MKIQTRTLTIRCHECGRKIKLEVTIGSLLNNPSNGESYFRCPREDCMALHAVNLWPRVS